MASFKKSNIWQGFKLIRSATDQRQDVGVRRVRLTGGADADTDIANAAEFMLNNAGSTFPGTTLPLDSVQVTGYSNTDQYGRIIYRNPQFSYTPDSAQQLVTTRTGFEGVEWYRLPYENGSPGTPKFDSDGFPSGSFNGVKDETQESPEPRAYIFRIPTLQIYVFTTLGFDPTGDVISLEGKLNSGPVTWGGHSFAAKTLRFNTAIIDWRQERNELVYDVRYSFTAKASWKMQSVYYDTDADPSTWKSDEGSSYETAGFGGAFPVHG